MDLYCERTGPEFWSEPINALTNVAFLVAAFFAWRLVQAQNVRSSSLNVLIALMATVGVGSFLFHTFATYWAMWLDMIPILLFMLYLTWTYSREQLNWSSAEAGALAAVLLVGTLAGLPMKHILNGSIAYVPAWLVLCDFGALHIRRQKNEPWLLMSAAILLLTALTFRTIDLMICGVWPYGTHFLWHLINGGVFYLAVRALIVNTEPNPRSEPLTKDGG